MKLVIDLNLSDDADDLPLTTAANAVSDLQGALRGGQLELRPGKGIALYNAAGQIIGYAGVYGG